MIISNSINMALEGPNLGAFHQGIMRSINTKSSWTQEDFSKCLEKPHQTERTSKDQSFDSGLEPIAMSQTISTKSEEEPLTTEQVNPALIMPLSPFAEKSFVKNEFIPEKSREAEIDATEPLGVTVQFTTEDLRLEAFQAKQKIMKDPSLKTDLIPKSDTPILIKDFKNGSHEQEFQHFNSNSMSTPMLQILQSQDEKTEDIDEDFISKIQIDSVIHNPSIASESHDIKLDPTEAPPSIEINGMVVNSKGKDTLEIQLYPEFLGKVDVKLSIDHGSGRLQAIILPETLEGYKAVLKEQTHLKESIVTHLENATKKEGSLISTIEIKVHEPQSTKFDSSDFQGNFSSPNHFSNHDQKRQESQTENHFLLSKNYLRAEYIQESTSLNENRRIDLAV